MSIYDKLEEIRKKPEHVRMRFVWAMVTLSMIFVLVIWAISMKADQKKDVEIMNAATSSEIVNQFKEQKDSLKNVTEGFTKSIQQGQ